MHKTEPYKIRLSQKWQTQTFIMMMRKCMVHAIPVGPRGPVSPMLPLAPAWPVKPTAPGWPLAPKFPVRPCGPEAPVAPT